MREMLHHIIDTVDDRLLRRIFKNVMSIMRNG